MAELLWKRARDEAKSVLDENWDQELPVNVESICRACGVKVYRRFMPDDLSGMIVKHSGDTMADAIIDAGEPTVRQRFTLAHELGHYIERTQVAKDDEFGFEEKRQSSNSGNDSYFPHEFFADEFAGSLLMPESKVKEYKDDHMSYDQMAKVFGVSVAAIHKRIDSLERRAPMAA